MGTRSRIILRRKTTKDIYLWLHYDGYFEGVGQKLCDAFAKLLLENTSAELFEKLEAIKVEDFRLPMF